MVDLGELYRLKAAALLHDPPNKAWIVAYGGHKRLSENGGHESEAKEFYRRIIGETVLAGVDILDDRVKAADMLAAGVDRWVLSLLWGKHAKPGVLGKGVKRCLRNFICPSQEIADLKEPSREQMEEFCKDLRGVLEEVRDVKFAYHLLYASFEPLWYRRTEFAACPADTRVPTHTVFDHLYATAAVTNWTWRGEGLLLCIDLAGVQSFIEDSRKLRDLWASSWLASALAWATVKPLVMEFGPDIMLLPTARHNPFYYYSLASKLVESKLVSKPSKVLDRFMEVAKLATGYDFNGRDVFPRHAVMPVTISLILPPKDVVIDALGGKNGDLEEAIVTTYREKWKELVENLRNALAEDKELHWIAEVFQEICNMGFDEIPPLLPRVAYVEVSIPKDLKDVQLFRIFNQYWEILKDKFSETKRVKCPSTVFSGLTERTRKAWYSKDGYLGYPKKSRRGYEYCTTCGKLPAVLVVPREEEYDEMLSKKGLGSEEIQRLRLYLVPGERLCPYCLVKRLVTLPQIVIKAAVNTLIGKPISPNTKELRLNFPSIGTVGSIHFKEKVVNIIIKLSSENMKKAKEICEKHLKNKLIDLPPIRSSSYYKLRELANKLEKEVKDRDLKAYLEYFFAADAEELYLGRENREFYSQLIRELKQIDRNAPGACPYYAIIRADGDSMGKILSGKLEEAIGLSLEEYIVESLNGVAREIAELALIKGEVEKAVEVLSKELGISLEEARENIDNLLKAVKGEEDSKGEQKDSTKLKSIPPSITFLTSISRALMVTALLDSMIVEKNNGFVVYAGGDDLLALAPVEDALNIVIETRRLFSLGSTEYKKLQAGFLDPQLLVRRGLARAVIPSLYGAGRSYSLLCEHYRYPMQAAMRFSHNMLESVSKEVEWYALEPGRDCSGVLVKDSLTVAFSTQAGLKAAAVVPLALSRALHGERVASFAAELAKLYESVGQYLTTSFIYDLLEWLREFWEEHLLKEELAPRLAELSEPVKLVLKRIALRNKTPNVSKEAVEKRTKIFIDKESPVVRIVAKREDDNSGEKARIFWLPYEVAKALKAIRSGSREVVE